MPVRRCRSARRFWAASKSARASNCKVNSELELLLLVSEVLTGSSLARMEALRAGSLYSLPCKRVSKSVVFAPAITKAKRIAANFILFEYILPMGLLFSSKNNNKIGVRHWIRVVLLLAITALLTYYAKFAPKKPNIARVHGASAWIMPTPRGLSALIVLPNDGNDQNDSATGLRIWINPPLQPYILEDENHIRYRGTAMALIGDSIPLNTLDQLGSIIDTGGTMLILGQNPWSESMLSSAAPHLQFERFNKDSAEFAWLKPWVGKGVEVDLRFVSVENELLAPQLTFDWEGYRSKWWPNAQIAAQDTLKDSLAVGVILECMDSAEHIPHALNNKVKTLIYCGGDGGDFDSTRIVLGEDNMGAAFVDDRSRQKLLVRKMHLKWKVAEH